MGTRTTWTDRQRGPVATVGRSVMRLACRRLVAGIDLVVQGREHLPTTGPVLIVARHVHHLYDGSALIAAVPRTAHLVVALDWLDRPVGRRLMEWACATMGWPTLLRAEVLHQRGRSGAYRSSEVRRYMYQAANRVVQLLHAGHLVVIFPEAYPIVDPHAAAWSAAQADDRAVIDLGQMRPFRQGCVRLIEMAERRGQRRVAIVPAGLHYQHDRRWQVRLQFGAPLYRTEWSERTALLTELQERVGHLSGVLPVREGSTLTTGS